MVSSPEIKAITHQCKTDPNEQDQIPDVFILEENNINTSHQTNTAYPFNIVIIYDKRSTWKYRYAVKTCINYSTEQ